MNTKKIAFIDPDEDTLEQEVLWAVNNTQEVRFNTFLQHQMAISL